MVSVLPHMTTVLLSNIQTRTENTPASHISKKKKAMNWYVIITEDKMLMMQSKSIMLLALL